MALASVEGRRDLFRQHVLRAGEFALRYSREQRHDGEALDRQRDNILQAIEACGRYADAWQTVVEIALSIHDHMEQRGYWEVWEQYLERALKASHKLGDARAEGALLNHLGAIRRHRGRGEAALALHEKALQIFQGLQDETGIIRSCILLGHAWWLRGGGDEAREYFETALEIAEQAGDELGMAGLYAGIGHTHSLKGEWEEVLKYSQRVVQITERLGDTALLAQARNDMGYACWQMGRWTEARHVFERTMNLTEQWGERVGLAIACNNLAALLLDQGEWKPALEVLEQEMQIVEAIGDVYLLAHAYDDMGDAYRQAGEWGRAWRYLGQSAELERQLDDVSGLAATHHHMGLLCTDQGEHEQALEHYRRALELREQLESEQEVAEILTSLAWAHSHRRAWNEMRPIADRAWTLAARLGRRDLLTRLLWLEAEIALAEGRPDEAHAAYERALGTSRSDDNDRLIALYRETRLRNEKSTPGRLGTLSSSPRPRDA